MNNKFNNLIKTLKNEKMAEDEKMAMKFRLSNLTDSESIKNIVQSPYLRPSPYIFVSRFSFGTFVKTTGVALLLVIIGFGGLTFASASALPGDWLWGVKTNVKEALELKLAFTTEQKTALMVGNIKERYREAKELIKQNSVTTVKQNLIKTAITKSKKEIENNLEIISKDNPEGATATKENLDTLIKTQKEEIGSLVEEQTDIISVENELTNSDTTFEKDFANDLAIIENTELEKIDDFKFEVEEKIPAVQEVATEKLLVEDTEVLPSLSVIADPLPTSNEIDNASTTDSKNES